MLKAIELVGFKSFADKARFEFPPGITVVVGPNGSGKSNVVDALKWVLGEQSAKSLRGKDMTDVIFKGSSGEGGRKPANAAEATIILDNGQRSLPFDTDEVHITRRVYRSGEGEYQINRETCRLKDIKNLFRGTGVGTDAYSLIEQGKVDQLLQASANERRAIFEEAAGISRFKAKKIESERRLGRVEQNLVRLADIVEEVGSRYRSVKAQASKAVRYREYNDRLRHLRTYVGAIDWARLTKSLDSIVEKRGNSQSALQHVQSSLEEQQSREAEMLQEISARSEASEKEQLQFNELVQKISSLESTINSNRARQADLESRISSQSEHLGNLKSRQADATRRLDSNSAEFEKAELEFDATKTSLQALEQKVNESSVLLDQLNSMIVDQQSSIDANSVSLNENEKKREAISAQLASDLKSKSRMAKSLGELNSKIEKTGTQVADQQSNLAKLENQAESNDTSLTVLREKLEQADADHEAAKGRLEDVYRKQVGMSQRADVIQEMEKRLEGVNAGVKQLLASSRDAESGPLSEVIGIVADLIQVNVQHAAIVDLALGEATQFLVINGNQLIDSIADGSTQIKGRTGFIKVGAPVTLNAAVTNALQGKSGVIGRLDSLVLVSEGTHQSTLQRLLSGTWVVKDLASALDLFDDLPARVRFVTLDNQVVEADGTILIGPRSANAGLISRRSELRALQRELHQLESTIENAEHVRAEALKLKQSLQEQFDSSLSEQTELATQISDQKSTLNTASKQLEIFEAQKSELEVELNELNSAISGNQDQLVDLEKTVSTLEISVAQLSESIVASRAEVESVTLRKSDHEKASTALKVQLAKSEQQLDDWGSRQQQSSAELDAINKDIGKTEAELETDRESIELALKAIETAEADMNGLIEVRDSLREELNQASNKRKELDQKRREYSNQISALRTSLDEIQAEFHQAEIQERQWKLEKEQLASRLLDDYGIEIATADAEVPDDLPEDRADIDKEIEQLRRKISNIGAVNMDAVNELDELEGRFNHLNAQYEDMVSAKDSLERLIHRINGECRKLYVDTLDTIRTNFQELFRKTFGGGRADIVLEEGVDPLEAGVELIATPPGKTSFNNSLLSGGEKAMTAVALLMAIFQFRPSPFCVLDEVDAPFDEANIGRFLDVLKSFLSWTKFVIVTHSKKTMTAADTLYGVTMQESGVSNRVSVRFEDVSDDGHINPQSDDSTSENDDDQRVA